MSKDARAWREEAAAATAGGKHKRALAAYLELERLESRDAQWSKRAAEAYRKLGRDGDAIAAYSRSADRYSQNGFLVQAIAVYKLILQIDPRHGETLRRLAAMNDQVGAGPTRAGEMAEHNVGLHENQAVAMIRQPRFVDGGGFELPEEEMDLDAYAQAAEAPVPARAPALQQTLSLPRIAQPQPQVQPQPQQTQQVPRAPQPAQSPQQAQRQTQQLPRLQQGQPQPSQPLPRQLQRQPQQQPPPQQQQQLQQQQQQLHRNRMQLQDEPQTPRRRVEPAAAPPVAVARTRSASIALSPGLALDSVKMSDAVPESRQHSQAGIYMIPIDDADLIPEAELDAAMEADGELELAPDPNPPEAIDISLDTIPPKRTPPEPSVDISLDTNPPQRRSSEVSMELSPSDMIDLHPHQLEESTELDLEDLEEIPLAAPKQIGAQALKALQATPLFAGLPGETLAALINRLAVVTLEPDEILFREGDPGDSLYVVVEGEVVMNTEGPPRNELARFGPGAFIGEVALMTDQPRAATVSAVDSAELLQIDRATLAAVLAEHGDALRAILRFVRDRLVDRWTRTSPLFRPFDDSSRAELAARFKFLEIEAGTVLLASNKKPDGLYIVLAGQFSVERNGTNVAMLGSGDLIGETALLSGGTFRSNVVALGRSLALCLPASEFREIIMTHPHVLEYIGEQAEHSRRLQIL